MKEKFDLNDPAIKSAVSIYVNKIEEAFRVPQTVEKAVLPIYAILQKNGKLKNVPQQIGSGVLVKLRNEYFIFSASHVFDGIKNYRLLTGGGDNSEILSLPGDRFSSLRGNSGTHNDDPIDASVFHIKSTIPDYLKAIALTPNDFDFSHSDNSRPIFMAVGFRAKKSKNKGNSIFSVRESFPSTELHPDGYSINKIDHKIHMALACEKQIIIDNRWNLAPQLNGISGGAIVKISGISVYKPSEEKPKQLLSAITIQQLPETNMSSGILLGTRLSVHLGLIKKYLPDLFSL